jgi:hypothetical protein
MEEMERSALVIVILNRDETIRGQILALVTDDTDNPGADHALGSSSVEQSWPLELCTEAICACPDRRESVRS